MTVPRSRNTLEPTGKLLVGLQAEPGRHRGPDHHRVGRDDGNPGSPDCAAGPLQPGNARLVRCAPDAGRGRFGRICPLARNRCGRTRCILRHPLRLAHQPDRRRARGQLRAVAGRRRRTGRGLLRRSDGGGDHAHHRPAALLAGDPARARARRHAGAGIAAARDGPDRWRNTPISREPPMAQQAPNAERIISRLRSRRRFRRGKCCFAISCPMRCRR